MGKLEFRINRGIKKATGKSKKALQKGKEITYSTKEKCSKTSEASFAGDDKVAKTDDLDVNKQDSDGVTALMLASREGHIETVKTLLDKGAQVNIQDESGTSALMEASKQGHTEVVQLLLDHGAHVNMQNEGGKSALILASENGETEPIELLIKGGADVNMYFSSEEDSALTIACEKGYLEVVKLLVSNGAQIESSSKKNDTPLMIACEYRHYEVVNHLLDKGAKINYQECKEGASALMCACDPITNTQESDANKIVQLLLDKGAQVNVQINDGLSALMIASYSGFLQVVQLLLDKGAQVNMQKNDGASALMAASEADKPQVVQLLLDKGAQVNMQDCLGYTALTYACEKNSYVAAEQLLKNGADFDHLNNDGLSLLMVTCANDEFDPKMADLLLGNGAQIDLKNKNGQSSLMIVTQSLHNERVQKLLQHGAFVDIQDNEGLSPLMLASRIGSIESIDSLKEYGAQLDLQDKDGKSALFHAVSSGCVDLVSHLIELGAQVNLQDSNGWFPLMYAVKAGDLETVQILIAYGASIGLRNCNGQTIFDVCPQELINLPLFQELLQTLLNTVTDDLKLDSDYPGIVFYETPISKRITSSGATIDRLQDMGISISVSEGSLSPSEEPLDLIIHPCLRGPFRLPKKYEFVSPVYLISLSRKTDSQKDVTLKIHHYTSLTCKEDCEDMAFFSASSTPEFESSEPVYTFKKIRGAKTTFRPGDQVGEISLRHFSFGGIGKKRSRRASEAAEKDYGSQLLYSASLYRNMEHKGDVSAVFSIFPNSPFYIKYCNKKLAKYTGMSEKDEGRSQIPAQIVGDGVMVLPGSESGSILRFDRNPAEIKKEEICIPKKQVGKLLDYPPTIKIMVVQSRLSFDLPAVQIVGLNRECSLPVLTQPLHTPTLQQPLLHLGPQSLLSPDAVSLATPPDLQMGAKIGQELQFQGITSRSDSMATLATVDSNPLDCDNDLGDVVDAVESLASKWRRLCTKLRLKESILDVIEHNNSGDVDGCLHKALGEWLKLNYDHQRHGRPSWRRLAEAVSSLDYALSEKIAMMHTAVTD